jgi:hypothetical protein
MDTDHHLAENLLDTLKRVEQGADVEGGDGPALLELRRIILLRVDTLEHEGASEIPPKAEAARSG